MPSGSGAQMGLTRCDSLYNSVQSVDFWTNFVSESVEHTLNELQEASITGYKDAPPSHKGIDFGQGEIQLEPNPNAIGAFMRGAFGQSSGSILTEAGSWGANSGNALNMPAGYAGSRPVVLHRFVPRQSAWDERTFLPPYEMMIYKDLGSAFFFDGTIFNSIEFNFTAGQLVAATVSAMSRKVTRYARTSSIQALRNPGGRPWVWDMASIQTGLGVSSLAANTNFESLSIKLETPVEGVVLMDGTKNYAEYQVNGFRSVAMNGTISFRSQEEYDAFVAYENRFMRVAARNVNSALLIGNPASANYYNLELDVPLTKFLTWSTPVGGPNRLITNFTARAEFDVTSLYQIEARLTNTTSAY